METGGAIFIRWVLLTIAVSLFILGGWMVYLKEAASSASAFGGGALSFVLANLREFKRIGGFGMQAERLEEKVREADIALDHIRSLAAEVSAPILTIAARLGRWNTAFSQKETYDLMVRIKALLNQNKVPPEKIDHAFREFDFYILLDMARPIKKSIMNLIQEKIQSITEDEKAYPKPINENDIAWQEVNNASQEAKREKVRFNFLFSKENMGRLPETLEAAIDESSLFNDEEKDALKTKFHEEIDDIKYFSSHKDFRRLDHWLTKDEDS